MDFLNLRDCPLKYVKVIGEFSPSGALNLSPMESTLLIKKRLQLASKRSGGAEVGHYHRELGGGVRFTMGKPT